MKKYLFYLMQGQQMCALHALMNAEALAEEHEVKIIFEGQAVKLPGEFAKDENPLYKKLVDGGQVAGVCKACSNQLGVLEEVKELGLPILDDMNGHAGVKPYTDKDFEVMVF
mgnify:CR=1 FL=1